MGIETWVKIGLKARKVGKTDADKTVAIVS